MFGMGKWHPHPDCAAHGPLSPDDVLAKHFKPQKLVKGYDPDEVDDFLDLVAQSMAGFTAPLVCDRLPVRLLVLLNAMIPDPGETGGGWWENTGQHKAYAELAAAQGRVLSDEFDVVGVFFHDVPDDVTAEALQRGGPEQSDTPFTQPWPADRWPDVPTRVLVGRDDRLFPLEFQRRVAQERLGLPVDEIPGGHLLALSRPRELADRLESYTAALG